MILFSLSVWNLFSLLMKFFPCYLLLATCLRIITVKRNFDTCNACRCFWYQPFVNLPLLLFLLLYVYFFQIWDFHLGRLRGHKDSNSFDDGYGTSNMGFTIKNFGEFLKETSPTSPKLLGETYQINCSSTHDELPSFNVSPTLFFTFIMVELLVPLK